MFRVKPRAKTLRCCCSGGDETRARRCMLRNGVPGGGRYVWGWRLRIVRRRGGWLAGAMAARSLGQGFAKLLLGIGTEDVDEAAWLLQRLLERYDGREGGGEREWREGRDGRR